MNPLALRSCIALRNLFHVKVTRIAAWCFAPFLFVSPIASGTSFVVVYTGGRMYVGADGLRVTQQTSVSQTHCKIISNGRTTILAWGLGGFAVREKGQFIWQLFSTEINSVLDLPNSAIDKRDMLVEKARAFMVRSIENEDRINSTITPEYVKRYGIGAAIIIMGEGGPRAAMFHLSLKDWTARKIDSDPLDDLEKALLSGPVSLGRKDAFNEFKIRFSKDPGAIAEVQRDPVTFIKKILTRQHELTPLGVGPPNAIAVLDGPKLPWIEKGDCDDK